MAFETLPADIQGCINIPLIRGDDRRIEMIFTDDTDAPIDLGDYDIKMEARQGAVENTMPVATFVPGNGLEIDGNKLTLVFAENSPIFQRNYRALDYDIAFTNDDVTKHWIKGQISITKSETVTWK